MTLSEVQHSVERSPFRSDFEQPAAPVSLFFVQRFPLDR
jgi:hypothetical protein